MTPIKELVKIILSQKYENDPPMKEKISKQIDDGNYVDLKIITPEGSWIKKEQLLNLEKEFSKKSFLDNKSIYIIDKAENLNDSSANTILKFLEEPQSNIIAILLTNNRYQVLDTIVSRCQILSLGNFSSEEKYQDEAILKFIDDIKQKKDLIIYANKYQNNLFVDRELAKTTLSSLERYFCHLIEEKNLALKEDNPLKNMDNTTILQYINVISNNKEKLQYNVNLKLWLTNFLIKLMEVE